VPAIAALLLLALLSCLWPPSPVAAASTGRIYGQLLNGSNKNTPIAGQSVTLQMAQGNNARNVASVKTDANGAYAFPQLATDKSMSYALSVSYMGAQYSSAIVTLAGKSVQQLNLTVYDATSSTANIAVVRATILLQKPDAQKGSVSVSELYIFRNLGPHAYVGSLDTSHGRPNALLFSLPHTARNVTLNTGFDGYSAVEVDSGIATTAAVPPGDSQFAFTFDMPYFASSAYDFDYKAIYPTVQLALLLPPSIHGSSSVLASHGPVKSGQNTFNLFQASALAANSEVHLELNGLPTNAPPATGAPVAPNFDAGKAWLIILLLLAMTIILLATGLIYRARRRPSAFKKRSGQQQGTSKPPQHWQQGRAKGSSAGAAAAKLRQAEEQAADDEQALLQKLLELDKAFEAGKLSKAIYQERRAQVKARLRALLGEKVIS
jgi:5-hydroxyisourate hydrolase-like protein (transthyretin family)